MVDPGGLVRSPDGTPRRWLPENRARRLQTADRKRLISGSRRSGYREPELAMVPVPFSLCWGRWARRRFRLFVDVSGPFASRRVRDREAIDGEQEIRLSPSILSALRPAHTVIKYRGSELATVSSPLSDVGRDPRRALGRELSSGELELRGINSPLRFWPPPSGSRFLATIHATENQCCRRARAARSS